MPKKQAYIATDDQPLFVIKRDVSGGMNNREHEQVIDDKQAVLLQNITLDTEGQLSIRAGMTRIDSNYPSAPHIGYGLFGFDPDGGQFELLAVQNGGLDGWAQSGSFINRMSDLTDGLQTTIIKAGMTGQNDIVLISNGIDNVKAMYQDHSEHDLGNTNTSPPLTTAITYYMNRVWTLLKNSACFSDAFPADYSVAFNQAVNAFRIPVGTAQAIIPTRDQGLVFFGSDQVWQLSPSVVPNPTTDFPNVVLRDIGCVNGYTCVPVADDIIFLAKDGIRGLFRTQLDKLQTGQSYPLSWPIKTQFDNINWSQISKASAVFFQNKYIISVPTGTSTYPNEIWVYYPALSTAFYQSTNQSNIATKSSWVVFEGWNISKFAKLRLNGQELLYGIDSVTGKVRQLFSGNTDDGTPIVFDYISKAEDFKAPMQYKYGGELKVRSEGGNGTLIVYANADGQGNVQLGTLDLGISGVTFPTTFPITFSNVEINGTFHLDNAGIIKFKRCRFEFKCSTSGAIVNIIESVATCFQEPYLSEG